MSDDPAAPAACSSDAELQQGAGAQCWRCLNNSNAAAHRAAARLGLHTSIHTCLHSTSLSAELSAAAKHRPMGSSNPAGCTASDHRLQEVYSTQHLQKRQSWGCSADSRFPQIMRQAARQAGPAAHFIDDQGVEQRAGLTPSRVLSDQPQEVAPSAGEGASHHLCTANHCETHLPAGAGCSCATCFDLQRMWGLQLMAGAGDHGEM